MVDTIKLNVRVGILKYLGSVYTDFYFNHSFLKPETDNNTDFQERLPSFQLESYSGTGNIFDLASISKALGVSLLILYKMFKGMVDPHSSIGEFIKGTKLEEELDYRLKDISIYDILAHKSGLPSWKNFYTRCQGEDNPKYDKKYLIKRLNFIACNQEISSSGNTLYSDVGFILLGLILEEVEKQGLDKQFSGLMSKLFFVPTEGSFIGYASQLEDKTRFIPTCKFCPLRQKMIQGEVHDENSYYLGGKTGHAGIFSDGGSLKKFLETLFNSEFGEFVRTTIVKDMGRSDSMYSFGFRRGLTQDGSHYYLSKDSFGHTGFTGGCFWIGDQRQLIFLTNRTIFQRKYPMQDLREQVLKNFIVE